MATCGLPVYHPLLDERFDDLVEGLDEFREHLGGELTIAMPDGIGSQRDINHVDTAIVENAIASLRVLHSAYVRA
jgi:3-dehydroquinate synthase